MKLFSFTSTVFLALCISSKVFSATCGWTQNDARFRNDDNSETSATWRTLVNTNLTETALGVNHRLRIGGTVTNLTGSAGGPGNTNSTSWQYCKNCAPTTSKFVSGVTINTSSAVIRSVTSPNVSDQTQCTEQIVTSGNAFTGACVTATGSCTASNTIANGGAASNGDTESELIYQINPAAVVNNDTLDFQMSITCTNNTYSEIRATVSIAPSIGAFLPFFTLLGEGFSGVLAYYLREPEMKLIWSQKTEDN